MPDYAWALVHRSKAHRHRRAYNKALADAYRAAELDPVGAWVLANKIETDLGVGRLERARSDLERYHSLDGDTEWARRQLVTVHLLSGRLGEALAEADTAATRCAVHLRMRNWRLARQDAEQLRSTDECQGLLHVALAVSGAEGVAAARPLWTSLTGAARHPDPRPLMETVASAAVQDWPRLDAWLHRGLTGYDELATLADCLRILLHSPGADRSRHAPRLARAIAARDEMRARYAE
ncbi:hypothetical protein ACF1GT_29640 [Streptomyces sp. NPDC014636]|uniref:hypothetical protein n=1 Tax=Streptomyces sp. NPDC014636 TaxID=3364876 RepID=UPI00370164A0